MGLPFTLSVFFFALAAAGLARGGLPGSTASALALALLPACDASGALLAIPLAGVALAQGAHAVRRGERRAGILQVSGAAVAGALVIVQLLSFRRPAGYPVPRRSDVVRGIVDVASVVVSPGSPLPWLA